MGATGSNSGDMGSLGRAKTFDIKNAKRTSFADVGQGFIKGKSNSIQLSIPGNGKSIIFQFELTESNKLSVRAYDPNTPLKGTTHLSLTNPSLAYVQKHGSAKDKAGASKIAEIMTKSTSGITPASFQKIANELATNKNKEKK